MPPQGTVNYNGQQMGSAMAAFLKANPQIANQNSSLAAGRPTIPQGPTPGSVSAPLTHVDRSGGGDIPPGFLFPGQTSFSDSVASAKAAQADYDAKFGAYQQSLQGVANQQTRIQAENAAAAQAQTEAQKQAALDQQTGTENDMAKQKLAIDQQKAATKGGIVSAMNPTSLVDYLGGQGQDSSVAARAKLAQQYGLVSSAQQYIAMANAGTNGSINTQLLSKLQGAGGTTQGQNGETYGQNPPQPNAQPSPEDQYNSTINALNQQTQSAYDDYKSQVDQIRNGTFPLTPTEQALVDSTQASFDRAKAAQDLANKAYAGGVTVQAQREGLSEYSPTIGKGQIFNAITVGIQKIADLDQQATKAIATLKQGFMDQDYKMITDQYKTFTDSLTQRESVIMKLHEDAYQHEKDLRNYNLDVQKFDQQKVTDAASIQHAKNQDAIASAELKLKGLEFNAVYGAFLDANGNPRTDIKPSDIPGVKQSTTGAYYFDPANISDPKQKAVAESLARKAGIAIVDAKDSGVMDQLDTALNRLTTADSLFSTLAPGNIPGAKLGTKIGNAFGDVANATGIYTTDYQAKLNAYNTNRDQLISLVNALAGSHPRINMTELQAVSNSMPKLDLTNMDTMKAGQEKLNLTRSYLYDAMRVLVPNANFPQSGDKIYSSTDELIKSHPDRASQAAELARKGYSDEDIRSILNY